MMKVNTHEDSASGLEGASGIEGSKSFGDDDCEYFYLIKAKQMLT